MFLAAGVTVTVTAASGAKHPSTDDGQTPCGPSTHESITQPEKERSTTWMDLETTMLSERSRHRRTHCGIPWMGNIQIRHNHRDREWVPGCQGLGEGMRGDC